ncbi:MAG: SH3 domain-containing protein, partial [bacterium]
TEGVPLTVRFGAGWQIYDNVVIAADIQKTAKMSPEYHVGGEVRLLETIPIRMGLNHRQITGGVGLLLPLANHTLELNYGYSNDRIVGEPVHRVSLVFSFGSNSSRVFRRGDKRKPLHVRDSDNQDEKAYKDLEKGRFYVMVTARVLNVRSGAGTKYRKVAKIFKGQKFEALEKRGSWRKIKLKNGKKGWVHGNYVRIVRSN